MKEIRFVKILVLLNGAVPAFLLGVDAFRGELGANPVNFAIRTTGLLALIFLFLSLTTTPAGRITGWTWLTQVRRMLGLYAFFHALAHFIIFFVWDRAMSVGSTISEMILRPYLTVGAAGLLLMVPLAVTSTNGMIKRLGGARWKRLHRLAYVAAIAGTVHYYMLVKADTRQPIAFGIVLAVLLGYRVVASLAKRRAGLKPPEPIQAKPTSMPRPKFWSGQLRVARIFVETPDVRTFRLVPSDGVELPFDYLPGQYLNLALVIDGRKTTRSYTIASSPTRRVYCEITVKREARGTASKYLHDQVREGDLLNVSAPAGRFTFTGKESESLVLIAGGVGITPLMSKVRYLTDRAWPGEIFFLICVRAESDIIFREELEYLQRRHPNLHVTVTLTRADGTGWTGERGRITPELLMRSVPQLQSRPIHFCGPEEMNATLREMLRSMAVPEDQVHFESFNRQVPSSSPSEQVNGRMPHATMDSIPVRPPANATPADVAKLTFARSGRSAGISATKTVLEAAEDLDVNIDYDCRAGICGTCKVKVLSGNCRLASEEALSPAERASGVILSCQAYCLDAVSVDA